VHRRDHVPPAAAFAGEGHSAVTGVTLGAPELLLGECTEISLEVTDEMGLENPLSYIMLVNCTDLFCQFEFTVQLVNHRLELGVHGLERPGRDITGIVGKEETFDLIGLAQTAFYPVD